MRETIDTVDWGAVPGHPDWYEPERAARGLRGLADAANLEQAARAGSLLGGGGIVHGHSAAVFPAAAVAAPFLLDIAQQGHPAARATALGLLDEALSSSPHAGYTRVATPYGGAVVICCAIAHQLRARADFLAGLGKPGRALLADAAEHWRFEIRECVADGGGTAAFGLLAGRFPDGVHAAELHLGGAIEVLEQVALVYPVVDGSAEACLRVTGRGPAELPPGTFLSPAECAEDVH
ncbi:hypothetical protein ACF073_10230 [Streptomyces sp. NPDC015171]|uniref:hypothetical protein n=1 Tax=Streptomyces sp. NPDC015171 TaxID=3364945 RepID=UPI0036FD7D6F